eukprot:COSAG05_NODE_4550_length_1467_cov_11.722861_1_plen_30_part_10
MVLALTLVSMGGSREFAQQRRLEPVRAQRR